MRTTKKLIIGPFIPDDFGYKSRCLLFRLTAPFAFLRRFSSSEPEADDQITRISISYAALLMKAAVKAKAACLWIHES